MARVMGDHGGASVQYMYIQSFRSQLGSQRSVTVTVSAKIHVSRIVVVSIPSPNPEHPKTMPNPTQQHTIASTPCRVQLLLPLHDSYCTSTVLQWRRRLPKLTLPPEEFSPTRPQAREESQTSTTLATFKIATVAGCDERRPTTILPPEDLLCARHDTCKVQ
jgi:hypothetical protein